jgi:signal transduction histidine kinase
MHIENLVTIIAGFVTLIVPIYLLSKNSSSARNRIYGLTSIITGPLWAITIVYFREATTLEAALFWDRGIYIVAVFIGILFTIFTGVYPRFQKILVAKTILVSITGFYFIYSIFFTNSFISEITLNDQGNTVKLGSSYTLWLFWMLAIFIVGGITIVKEFTSLGQVEKHQLKFFTLGVIFPAFAVVPTNAILPLFGFYQYIWIGPLFMVLMNIIIAYGITRTRFISANYIFSMILKIFLLGTFLFLTFWAIEKSSITFFGESFNSESIYIALSFSIVAAGLVIIFTKWLDNSFLKSVIRGQFDADKVRDEFNKETASQLDLDILSNLILNTLKNVLVIDSVGFTIFENDYTKVVHDQYNFIDSLSLNELMEIYENFKEQLQADEPIVLSELEYILVNQMGSPNAKESARLDQTIKTLNSYNIGMVFNIAPRINYKGLLLIGCKPNKEVYTLEEIDFIKSIISNISVSIGRAFLYTDVQNFNKVLETKIREATQEITKQRDAIEESLNKEHDMMDILGHELRTPLGIARNAVMVMHGLVEEHKLDETSAHKYIDMAVENLQREVRLVETILSGTKIDNNRISLKFEKVDAIDVINDSFEAFKKKADQKGLNLFATLPQTAEIYADRTRIQEIVDNLIDNAIKYTDKGQIEVKIENSEEYTSILVIDSGEGIPAEDIPKLGQKFYRINNYLGKRKEGDMQVVRPGGTGLGLYVIYNLARLMNGEIKVLSELGKGTSFIVKIPSYTNQAPLNTDPESSVDKMIEYKDKLKNKSANAASN